jgi:hypothetical protein
MANAPLAHSGAELLFQVLDEHSVLSSIVMTTNFRSARTEAFPDSRVCKAIIDGSTFNAHIIGRGTESWRFKKTLDRQQPKGREAQDRPFAPILVQPALRSGLSVGSQSPVLREPPTGSASAGIGAQISGSRWALLVDVSSVQIACSSATRQGLYVSTRCLRRSSRW